MQQAKYRFLFNFNGIITICFLVVLIFPLPISVHAASIDVEPLSWNIIGLDSNKPGDGPNHFPVGARVCNNTGGPLSNVKADFIWDDTTNSTYIYERPGTSTSITMFASPDPALASGDCADFYFEVEVLKVKEAYNKTRRYHIEVSSTETGAARFSTPRPRELYVEYLVSQSRNAVTDVQYGTNLASLTSVPNGGTMSLVVGQTYYIKLVGFTATQGYNQLESFINFPNTIFQVLSVESVYSAPTAGYAIDKMYSDACGWDNILSSPTYRSCIVSDDKTGGNISVTYEVRILSVPGGAFTNPEPLNTLIYDFSGSSYHYNADFGISGRYAYVLDPASVNIAKSFAPSTVAPGSSSTLTFTLINSSPVTVNNVSFGDDLPSLSDGVTTGQMVVSDPVTYSTSGCGIPTFSPTAGATSLSLSNGTIAPNGACSISVNVTIPDSPSTGAYTNISENAYVGGLDTGHNAAANLTVDSSGSIPAAGLCGQTLALWNYSEVAAALLSQPYNANDSVAATARMTWGNGITVEGDPSTGGAGGGNPTPGAKSYGWLKFDPINTATSPYIQFAVDTSGYSAIQLRFDAQRKSNGPGNDELYYSTNGTTWNLKSPFTSSTTWASYPSASTYYDFSGQTNTTGITYFRFYGNGANATSSGNDLSFDNILFIGCGEPLQPGFEKSFSPNPVVVGGLSTLTFTIGNPNSVALTGAKFTDTLPGGLEFDTASLPATTCTGTPSMSFTGNTTFNFGQVAEATIPPGGCTVSVNVKATTTGPHQNISDFISTVEGGANSGPGGSATASLVAVLPPVIDKSFNPGTILANETSALTFLLTNPNPSDALNGVAFSDELPAGMVLASDVTSSQCGGTVTGIAGSGTIGFSGGAIPAGGDCEINVEVTAPGLGDYVNTSGPVTTSVGGLTSGSDTATATLSVEAPNPSISILKRVSTNPTGPWSTFLTVTPGTDIYYQFTVENNGDVNLDHVSVSDPTLTGLSLDLSSCVWANLPRYSDAVTCVAASAPALEGNNPNTATAQGTYSVDGTTKTAISSASYVGVTSGALNLSKQISTSPAGPWSSFIVDVAPGSTVYYRFTVVNATGGPLTSVYVADPDPAVDLTVCGFTDPLPNNGATTCVVSATVSSVSVAKHTNTATAHGTDSGGNVVDSSPSSADYTPTSPDLTVTKSNSVEGVGAIGNAFTWTVTVSNNGTDSATFEAGETIVSDPLPAGAVYGTLLIGGGLFLPMDCAVTGGTLACEAVGDVTLDPGDSFSLHLDASPITAGDLVNTATVDPGSHVTESEEGNNEAFDTVSVLPTPSMTKTFMDNPIGAGGASRLRFTITNPSDSQVLSGVAFNDILPSGMTLTADAVASQCNGTITGLAGGNTVSLSGGSIAANSSCNVDVSVTVAAGGNYINTSGNVSSTNGGTGNTASATLAVFQADKSIVSTSEASTGFRDPYERVAVGEIIRYRLTTTLPEGTWDQFQIQDAVDTGIQFLNDGTTAASFVCNSTCSHSTFTISPGTFSSSTDPTFDLGTVTNPDNDSDAEYLILEFNALVLNMTSNVAGGLTRNNSYTVSVNGATVASSPSIGVRIVEPSISNLTKTVSPAAGPYYPGDTITYTLTFANISTGVNRATAFDVFVTDALDANLDLQSVSIVAPAGSSATDTSTLGPAGVVRVLFDQLPPTTDISSGPTGVTITVVAKILNTAPSGTISNTANLTYTGLPGGVTTGDPNGTCPNPTGSCTPATSVAEPNIGERNGTGDALNFYNGSAAVTVTVTNDPPVATDNLGSVDSADPIHTANMVTDDEGHGVDSDPNGDPLSVTEIEGIANPLVNLIGTYGTLAWNTDGSYTYTLDVSDPDYLSLPGGGTATDTFTYTLFDGREGTDTAKIIITVTGDNHAPTATDNAGAVDSANPTHSANMVTDDEGSGTDNDPDGNPLTVTQVDGESNPAANLAGIYGTLDWAMDGSYTYTLNTSDPDYLALAGGSTATETFQYTISDGNGGTDTANIYIRITGANDSPVANNDSFTTAEDTSVGGDLKVDNGSGADVPSGDGGNLWTKVTDPVYGTVTINPDGTFTYTPDEDYNGPDSFTYQICDLDNDCDQATVSLIVSSVEDPAIGVAKRVVDITRVGSGTFDITFEFTFQNYGDVAMSDVQATDDLTVAFPAPSTFTVQSVTLSSLINATLTANPSYNGSTDTNLLTTSGNSLAVNGSATVTIVVRVLPASSGPFFNSASASGETPGGKMVSDDSSDGTDPDNTANCPTCVNGDGDPSNNTKLTDINFDPNIFDPPFGFKTLDSSGLPVFRWTMVWINDNNFPSVASVSDPIPVGTTYEAAGASSGYVVPVGAPAGSSNLGVSCTADSAAEPVPGDAETITSLCYYEGPTGAYPRGRIVWQGLLGPDLGATDQTNANDELYITFNVRVANGISMVQNTASIDADLNNNANLSDPGEQIVATARANWQEPATPVDGREGRRLPGTGFAPGKVTVLPDQKGEQSYTDLGDLWLEIPSLGLSTPIVGVPKNAGVWDVDWLWEQAGWLQGTAFPTWQGNSVLTAHVYLPDGKPGPFVNLEKLRFGNQVIVHAFGQRYIYEIRTNHTILPTDMSPFRHEDKAWLTLLTCKGYDENSDSYKYRVKVRAVLLKVEAEP